MPHIRAAARTLILSLALAALPLSGCARTLSIPASASQPDRELTNCHAIQTELRELEPLIRNPFEHNGTPLGVLAIAAAVVAVASGLAWATSKNTFPSSERERKIDEDSEQTAKGAAYASLALLVASLGLNLALFGVSERDKAEQSAMRKRLYALRRMRSENDCVDYGAQ